MLVWRLKVVGVLSSVTLQFKHGNEPSLVVEALARVLGGHWWSHRLRLDSEIIIIVLLQVFHCLAPLLLHLLPPSCQSLLDRILLLHLVTLQHLSGLLNYLLLFLDDCFCLLKLGVSDQLLVLVNRQLLSPLLLALLVVLLLFAKQFFL